MCTIGAIRQGGRTFLLKNFDYPPPVSIGWSWFQTFGKEIPHFGLVSHFQQGINSGINAAGLGLVISQSDPSWWGKKRKELRTVINAETMARCRNVKEAVRKLRSYARAHPEMMGGNVILGDADAIAVIEYFRGKTRCRVLKEGFLARGNHSDLGVRKFLFDNYHELESSWCWGSMAQSLEKILPELPSLDHADIIGRCKKFLTTKPVFNRFTMTSMIMDVQKRQIEFKMRGGDWQMFRFASTGKH